MRTEGGYADTEWGQVHYRVNGRSGPWIGLFHESPLSSRVFEEVLPVLGRHARAVAFDTPGYGASDAPPGPGFEIPDYGRVLARAAAGIGMERPVLGGVHSGASLALAASAHLPVAGLVLSGVPLFTADERAAFIAGWTPEAPLDDRGSQFGWAVDRYLRGWGPGVPPELLHLAVVEMMRVAGRYDWGYQAAFRYDPADALAAADAPVLLLNTESDVLSAKDPVAMGLARDARRVVLPGLPGQPHLRAPGDFAAALLDFARETTGS
ncbi:alpha/beta fold hydrolase [Actinomadura latina]|uniref:Alpha/beta fold hydrolase n=1 Tax=Actinomadura latina TaxID=163603 RepID=A0A846Z3R9_9ACTN|nr:alpha/beta fold hydrolase [Actinomadura latina]NKZ07609.1 alpha/beta fold hydrolase [Actinomadura latina]